VEVAQRLGLAVEKLLPVQQHQNINAEH